MPSLCLVSYELINIKFRLPAPNLTISKSSSANYEIWPLRFEVDERGRIWEIISQSIYTGKFDFVRELIQNAIDAELFWVFLNNGTTKLPMSTRCWSMDNYKPYVLILYSELDGRLKVVDNGIGMDKDSLQNFLFKVSSSGYGETARCVCGDFPSIAKFGIGFVSILVRSDAISIKTKKRNSADKYGRKVIVKSESLNAYTEISDSAFGTSVTLHLKDKFLFREIAEYITKNIQHPSIPILFVNLDQIKKIVSSIHLIYTEKSQINNNPIFKLSSNDDIDISNYSPEEIIDSISKFDVLMQKNNIMSTDNKAYVHIKNEHITNKNINEIMVFSLEENFRIKDIKHLHESKIDNSDFFLIFIPVNFIDYDNGIEWHSFHGFIVYGKMVHPVIYRISLPNSGDNAKLFESEEYDSYTEKRNAYLRKHSMDFDDDDYKFGSSDEEDFDDEIDESRIYCNIDSIYFTKPEYKNKPVDFFSTDCSALHGNRIGDALIFNDKFYNEVNRFNYCREQLNCSIFQDGILIPGRTNSIAPFGFSRSIVNLTGKSRFDLNVSRNAINESPTLLSQWSNDVGFKIQKYVIEEILKTFKSYGIEFYDIKKDLVTSCAENNDPLSGYMFKRLHSLLHTMQRSV